MYSVLEDIVTFIWEYSILWVLLLTLLYLKKYTNHPYSKYLYRQTPLFIALFLVILLGFFTKQDIDKKMSCISIETLYSLKNIVYLSISLAFTVLASIVKNKHIRLFLLCIELLYWLYKLFFINKAHHIGVWDYRIVANVNPFDYLALVVRLQLINVVLEKKVKLGRVLIIAAIVILCKITFDIVPSMF